MQRIRALGFDEQGHTPDVPEKVQGGTRYQGRMIENERFYDSWIALNEHIQNTIRLIARDILRKPLNEFLILSSL